ncbi:hypothetical protein HPP92_000549 [Vanilla planifolia]|uniref:RING-type E3 ubiquitin transferase n=1 Tax=Vanilla planifolia TaxID=51239 RepID=A0A835SBD9_VANPL|nr:hypothetical protein HPP92_000549 [Vanilla planifolia]
MSSSAPQNGIDDQQRLQSNQSFNTGECIMLSAVLTLFIVVIVVSVHLLARYHRHYDGIDRFVVAADTFRPLPPPVVATTGLDPSSIAALPTYAYREPDAGEGADCAVCLSAAEEGELMRMMPGCGHVFHVECIDMWLHSHSTCPVCRAEAKEGSSRVAYGPGRWVGLVDADEVDLERQ